MENDFNLEEYCEEKFQEDFNRIFEIKDSFGGQDVSVVSSPFSLMVRTLVRESGKWGLFVSCSIEERDFNKFTKMVSENILFFGDLEETQHKFLNDLYINGWALLLFDSKETMEKAFGEVRGDDGLEPNYEAGPFYAMTIHRRGSVLNENT